MEQFKNENEIKDFFGGTVFQFQIISDGVAEFRTVKPIKIKDEYCNFLISIFPDENPFTIFDSLDDLMGASQIFEVHKIDMWTGESENIYHQKYIDYKNN